MKAVILYLTCAISVLLLMPHYSAHYSAFSAEIGTRSEIDDARPAAPLVCDDVSLQAREAEPLQQVALEGLPEGYSGEVMAGILTGGSLVGYALVDRGANGSWQLITPVHPSFTKDGGAVMLRIEDNMTVCDPIPFTITAISTIDAAPLDALVDAFESIVAQYASAFDTSIEALTQMSLSDAPPHLQPLIGASKQIRGTDGRTSIRATMQRDTLAPDLTDAQWELLLTLLARAPGSNEGAPPLRVAPYQNGEAGRDEGAPAELQDATGAVDGFALSDYWLASNTSTAALPPTARRTQTAPLPSATAHPSNVFCQGPAYQPSAFALQVLLSNYQFANSISRMMDHIDDYRAVATAGAALVGAVIGGGVGSRIGAGLVKTSTSFSALNFWIAYLRSTLPSTLYGFHILEHEPPYFLEDDDFGDDGMLTGRWDGAFVSARSEPFDFSREAAGIFWSYVGGTLLNKIESGVGNIGNLTRAQERVISNINFQMADVLLGDHLNDLATDRLEIPSCEFGPVDVTDEQWTRSEITESTHIAQRLDHQTYAVHATGQAALNVCVLDRLFDDPSLNASPARDTDDAACITYLETDLPIHVRAIDVRIVTADQPNTRGTRLFPPGSRINLDGIVSNANDPLLGWYIDPPGPHVAEIFGDGERLSIQTSWDEEDFPFTVTAQSMSYTGLRADPNAPPREYTITIDAAEPEAIAEVYDCKTGRPIQLTEIGACNFRAHLEGPMIEHRDYPDLPATGCFDGEVRQWRVNQHGVLNMEWGGRTDGGRLMSRFIVRIDEPGMGTLETSAHYFGGGLHIPYEYEVRSPIGGNRSTRTGMALHRLAATDSNVTVYPLAHLDYYAGTFDLTMEVNPGSRRGGNSGPYTLRGIFMAGESCSR